ncbi:MAG TPA: hypothetical protein VFI84_04405 [Candidatus Saccharimonadales bacterium]|nr:hypothetical protein [Candidatus Saccharimonadales bacterium]
MKLRKLNQLGVAHYILPALVVISVGAVGVAVLKESHAATTGVTNSAVLDSTYAQGASAAQSSVPYSFVGYKTVNYLAPGQALSYTQGIKGNVTACYEVYVSQPKSGTATATVEFANNNNYLTTNLSSSTTSNLQEVCVSPGRKANPGFSVKNLTPLTQNTNIEVYQATLKW